MAIFSHFCSGPCSFRVSVADTVVMAGEVQASEAAKGFGGSRQEVSGCFEDVADASHYISDYITKHNPIVFDVLPEQARGIERLHLGEIEASKFSATLEQGGQPRGDGAVVKGRRNIIRLHTLRTRLILK